MASTFEELRWGSEVLGHVVPKGFFAYAAAPPSIPEIIRAAAQSINKNQTVRIRTWEDLQVGGKYIIGEICAAIDECDFFCADITTINANVLFELGFAIARDKRVWLIRDDSYTDAKKEFNQLQMLTTVGYSPYVNVGQVIQRFFSEGPQASLHETIFRQSIEPTLSPGNEPDALMYLKSRIDTEASVRVTRVLQDSKLPMVVDDPRETSVQPLNWYAQKLFRSVGLATHFLSPAREGFRLHNARYALVSGLARGFDVPMLMLAEQSDLLAPIDYRDAMRYYTTPTEAARETDQWLQPIALRQGVHRDQPKRKYVDVLKLATELKDFHLQLGEYVAENEAEHLDEYFVETTAFMDVINGRHAIFVGRKGTGKTTNLIRASSVIGADVQNLVVLIKPVGYEIEGLVRLFTGYKTRDAKGYVIESLWKYMLYTEIAHAAAEQIRSAALWQLADRSSQQLLQELERQNSPFSGDFTIRLERIVGTLSSLPSGGSHEEFRSGISEALHSGALSALRRILAEVLGRKRQVVLLVDNLDKPWTKSADLDKLSEFLLGLLNAAARITEDLRRKDGSKGSIRFNSAIFLRSDIFDRVTAAIEEPDKISYTRLSWDDPELLLRIIEERYTASHGSDSDPATMWHNYFCPQVRGVPTREYLTLRTMPRPRDIVFLVKSAVSFAVNRKHDRVEERDILDAEKQYSLYALDSILVENGITIPQMESVLLEFLGCDRVLDETNVRQVISRAGVEAEKVDSTISHLVKLTFLGIEVEVDRFQYADEPRELKKAYVLANRYSLERGGGIRYQINPAFRAYLEVHE
jgi:hypothetical protein